MSTDNWKHRSKNMCCTTCMWYITKAVVVDDLEASKEVEVGRCRRHGPTMSGWPVMFKGDWCGDHKLDETKI